MPSKRESILSAITSTLAGTTGVSTRNRYSLATCGAKYDRIFQTLADLHGSGWYTLRPET